MDPSRHKAPSGYCTVKVGILHDFKIWGGILCRKISNPKPFEEAKGVLKLCGPEVCSGWNEAWLLSI